MQSVVGRLSSDCHEGIARHWRLPGDAGGLLTDGAGSAFDLDGVNGPQQVPSIVTVQRLGSDHLAVLCAVLASALFELVARTAAL